MIDTSLANKRPLISFEVFPPKKDDGIEKVYSTLDQLSDLHPDFISVTFGAGGSENSIRTLDIAKRINDVCHVESVVHLPCINLSKNEAMNLLSTFEKNGIENILVLRGDKTDDSQIQGDFLHASDLASFIRKNFPGRFHLLGACYPENHPDSKDVYDEIDKLKIKIDSGVEHLLSQLFFDNEHFLRFQENCMIGGIKVPIEAGIMPVTNKAQIERMTARCGVVLPEKYQVMLKKFEKDDNAIMEAGIAYATNQIVELLSKDVRGIHLYTMNKPYAAKRIMQSIESLLNAF